MSMLQCGFCGRMSDNMDGWQQMFLRPMSDPENMQNLMICPKCAETYILPNIGTVHDPEAEFDAIRETYEDENPVKMCIGMTLRDFLTSPVYLQTQNVFFRDRYDMPIKEFLPFMDARILDVTVPDENEKRYIKLAAEISY